MREGILQYLMQLFAIVANVEGPTEKGRSILSSLLKEDLHISEFEKHLIAFEGYVGSYHHVANVKDGSAKRTSVNSVKVLKICNDINKELDQQQKVVVLIRLLEFIHTSGEIAEQELEFISIVIETFNIPPIEFKNILHFIVHKNDNFPNLSNILLINNKDSITHVKIKQHHNPHLQDDTEIWVIRIPNSGTYAMKVTGTQELTLNGQIIQPYKVNIMLTASSIRSSILPPIYYREIVRAFSQEMFF